MKHTKELVLPCSLKAEPSIPWEKKNTLSSTSSSFFSNSETQYPWQRAELIPSYSGSCEAWDPEFITKLSQTFPLGTWLTLCPEKNPLIRTSYSRGELICAVLNLPVVSYKALPQAQLSEDVYHNLHWGVVCYCKRAHIKDASQF